MNFYNNKLLRKYLTFLSMPLLPMLLQSLVQQKP